VLFSGSATTEGLFGVVPMAEEGGRRSASELVDASVLSTDSSFASDGFGHHERLRAGHPGLGSCR
jgi:hypothetical protein